MAGDSKIWIAALFMLVSFLFNAIKKKRKAEQDALEGQEIEPQNSESSWGVEDLISQFEQKYGVETEVKQSEFISQEEEYVEDYNSEYVADELDVKPTVNYVEETDSHSAIKREKDTKLSDDTSYQTDSETDALNVGLDLRNLVISRAILERPQY